MVKASELIREIKNGNYKAEVVDEGDLRPYLSAVVTEVDDNNRCYLRGYIAYHEDSERYSPNPGRSEVKIMGITFSDEILEGGWVKVDGDIEFDENLTWGNVKDAAIDYIKWPKYSENYFCFEESNVTEEDLLERIEYHSAEFEVYAFNEKHELCAFEYEEDMPKIGYSIVSQEEAYKYLAHHRPGLGFDFYF